MKLDSRIHIVMHSILFLKPNMTLLLICTYFAEIHITTEIDWMAEGVCRGPLPCQLSLVGDRVGRRGRGADARCLAGTGEAERGEGCLWLALEAPAARLVVRSILQPVWFLSQASKLFFYPWTLACWAAANQAGEWHLGVVVLLLNSSCSVVTRQRQCSSCSCDKNEREKTTRTSRFRVSDTVRQLQNDSVGSAKTPRNRV